MKKFFTYIIILFATATIKAQTPKFYFPFDGQSLNSTVGTYPLSTISGSASFTTSTNSGNGSHALSLDGSKYETTPFKLDTNATGLTISFWMKRRVNSNYGVMVSQLEIVQTPNVTMYYGTFNTVVSPEGYVFMEFYNSPLASSSVYSKDTVPMGWHYVTFKWANSKMYIYQNGVVTDSSSASAKILTLAADRNLTIGAIKTFPVSGAPSFQSAYKGDIDEIRFYESALTNQQILNLYNSGSINGVSQNNRNVSIGMFPNPSSSNLYFRSQETITKVEVSNILGEKIISENGEITELNISKLSPGVYTIQLYTDNGMVTRKFTKE